MESECSSMLRAALILSNKDIMDISSTAVRQRIQDYSQMEEYSKRYESNCARHLSPEIRNKDLANFKLAQLKIAYTMHTGHLNDTDSQLAQSISGRFTDDEYDAFSLFNKFSMLDTMKESDIATALVNKNEQIYSIIKEWYDEQMDNFLMLLDPAKTSRKISGTVSAAMRDRYNSRFLKIRAGLISYLNQDPGQLRKLFYNYEAMLESLSRSENRRLEVEREIRDLLSSEEADSVFEDFQVLSSYVQRRELSKVAAFDIKGLKNRTKTLIDKIGAAKTELERERDRIDNDPDMRTNRNLRDNENARLNETIGNANQFKERLENEIMKGIDDLKDISIQMEQVRKEGKVPEDEGVTQEQAQLLKNLFFQDIKHALGEMAPFTIRDPNAHYDFKVKDGKGLDNDDWRSEEIVIQADAEGPKLYASLIGLDLWKHRIVSDNSGISIRAAVLLHERLNEKHKIDMYQIGVSDFAPMFARMMSDAQRGRSFTYMVLGSPNGFSEDLVQSITGESKGSQIKGANMRVILRDLKTGKLHYDSSDEEARNFATIVAGKDFQTKQIGLFKARTLVECEKMGVVRSGLMQKITGSNEDQVISAWKQLEKEKKGKITEIEGETVFETALA